MTEPNRQQRELIENTEGVYLVDAGAGTGKTFTITRRYVQIIEKDGVEPEDVFLATFTRNAAEEMSERIVELSDVRPGSIFEAPISTFHSHCQKVLERHGFDAPQLLGFEENVTEETDVVESKVRERQEFEDFYSGFVAENQEYSEFFRICSPENLLDLVKSLASKGIIPEKEGWFGDTGEYLDGDLDRFKQVFEEKNQPRETSRGEKQSELRDRLYSYRWKNFEEEAPDVSEIRGGRGTKSVRRDFMEKSFEEDREKLKEFVHDLYAEYMRYCLSRGFLNFQFVLALAFVLLHEKPAVRTSESFEYVMIDEFQDTNEIQFKLALLLAEEPNIAAVGDWKQSIYSFQHASVENIQRFEERVDQYLEELLEAGKELEIDRTERIELKKNYRSAQQILDFSESSLTLPANRHENVSEPETVSLESEIDTGSPEISKFVSEDESAAVLSKIQELVESDEYLDSEGDQLGYGDVAVLTRTRKFGLELQERARSLGIPVDYEGGVELFTTPQAVLLLAWLRIVESGSSKGWAVVLEHAGYSLDEAEAMIDSGDYPPGMSEFKDELASENSIKSVARKVFDRYGYRDAFSDRIIEVLENAFRSSFMNTGQLIGFIEDNIEEGEIYEVETHRNDESVTVQTIHSAKGLEYPAVFVADVNSGVFPSQVGGNGNLDYNEVAGIRQKKVYSEDYSFVFDNWRYEILSKCFAGEYDEERRLMYVAMTRAENHLFFSAEKGRESPFFENLDLEAEEASEEPRKMESASEERGVFRLERS